MQMTQKRFHRHFATKGNDFIGTLQPRACPFTGSSLPISLLVGSILL